MKVLLVEDDYLQEEAIREEIEARFPDATVETIYTESDFRAQLPSIVGAPPDVVLMDCMIRWTDPSPEMDRNLPPPDVRDGGIARAGLRCQQLLASHDPELPVILYTVLDRADLVGLPKGVTYLHKSATLKPLVRELRKIAENHRRR
jgi:DNA-binding NarL/FixJ family response regulator